MQRLSKRWALHQRDDPVKIERDLMKLLPEEQWPSGAPSIILHGRRVCDALRPRCGDCVVEDLCPSSLLAGRRDLAGQARDGPAARPLPPPTCLDYWMDSPPPDGPAGVAARVLRRGRAGHRDRRAGAGAHGPPVYVRTQIVHNIHVVADLERKGAVFVEELAEVPRARTVVF